MTLYIILAFSLGCIAVLSRMINFQATKYLGTASGSLVNYVVASILSFFLFLCSSSLTHQAKGFLQAPAWLYLGGVFGLASLLISVISLNQMNLFQSTVIMLVGQLAGSIFLDTFLFHSMAPAKVIGVTLLAIGVIWDKKLSMT